MPFPTGIGQLTSDDETVTFDPASGKGAVVDLSASGGGGGGTVDSVVAGDGIAVDDTDPANPVVSATGGGGTVASFGASPGITENPGVINQAGGLNVNDTESDGISLVTNANMALTAAGAVSLTSEGNDITLSAINQILDLNGSAQGTVSLGWGPTQNNLMQVGSPTLPFTVVVGVNDTFLYYGGPYDPETFTVAPGVYATLDDLTAALNAAVGSGAAEAFDTYYQVYSDAPGFDFAQQGPPYDNGGELATGPTDILAGLGIPSPSYFAGGGDGDLLTFFLAEATAAAQQTVTGDLSAVTDVNAKAVLTSLIAALAGATGYNLILDGTT